MSLAIDNSFNCIINYAFLLKFLCQLFKGINYYSAKEQSISTRHRIQYLPEEIKEGGNE